MALEFIRNVNGPGIDRASVNLVFYDAFQNQPPGWITTGVWEVCACSGLRVIESLRARAV